MEVPGHTNPTRTTWVVGELYRIPPIWMAASLSPKVDIFDDVYLCPSVVESIKTMI